MSYSNEEIRLLVAQAGAENVGTRFANRTCETLEAMYAGHGPTQAQEDNDPENWIDDAVNFGENLDCETRLRMVIAAINAAIDHEGALWCIADMPVAHLVHECSLHDRFHAERKVNPAVDRMFRLMQSYYRDTNKEPRAGWWEDDYRQYLGGGSA